MSYYGPLLFELKSVRSFVSLLAQEVREALVQERDRMAVLLTQIPFLTPYPSNANFILCR